MKTWSPILLLAAAVTCAFGQGARITNSPTPGTVGISYSFQFIASGATSFVFSCQCTNPAPGLTLSAAGVISGQPTTAGSFSFLVQAAAATNPANNTGFISMALQIGVQPLTITTRSVSDATRGVLYNAPLTASGGSGGYSWTLLSGPLPNGLSVIPTGAIGGTPALSAVAGPYRLAVQVSD